ncbi:Pentatricopeptide repeat-containing protein [Forsythia ovata]|uniref:Pentatricopeptide repeat-containing protein n=1 Tax=Forsythia ovata TaxID=205694 RepID=A0ABD1SRF7_9LAMI
MEVLLTVSAFPPLTTLKLKSFSSISHKNGFPLHVLSPKSFLHGKYKSCVDLDDAYLEDASLKQRLSRKSSPEVAENFILEMKPGVVLPYNSTLSKSLLFYASNGFYTKAKAVWDEILNSSFTPDVRVVSKLITIYGCVGNFDMVNRIMRQMQLKDPDILPDIYALAISCFGKRGRLDCMDIMIKEMVSMGFSVDSATGNSYLLYYSLYGSLAEMEIAYGRLKRSRILIEEEAIRAMSFAYIKGNKFYALGQFLQNVGLGRRNLGNLLWNLLLLSYAANFKMKSLQREFVKMVEAGFTPDLTTFNIRALAFSRMSLFWDLHVSLEHMKHEAVVPDLVTYGCVVDAYLDKKLGRNLEFALSKLNKHNSVSVLTDPLVFEVMGKGDFHLFSEVTLDYTRKKKWTYNMLIATYLKKKFRSNQIFWNY